MFFHKIRKTINKYEQTEKVKTDQMKNLAKKKKKPCVVKSLLEKKHKKKREGDSLSQP